MRDWLLVGKIKPKANSTGYLAPYVPFIRYALKQGTSANEIAQYLYDVKGVRGQSGFPLPRWSAVTSMSTLIRNAAYINDGLELAKRPPPPFTESTLKRAINEHAFLLKCEGLTLQQIGDRLGVGRERARQRVISFSHKLSWAIRRAKYEVT